MGAAAATVLPQALVKVLLTNAHHSALLVGAGGGGRGHCSSSVCFMIQLLPEKKERYSVM